MRPRATAGPWKRRDTSRGDNADLAVEPPLVARKAWRRQSVLSYSPSALGENAEFVAAADHADMAVRQTPSDATSAT